MNDDQTTPEKKKLRPTQVAVIIATAFMMLLTAAMFGYGLYCLINPDVLSDGDVSIGPVVGIVLIVCAVIPAGAVWGLWMLWNDLATRTPGSAKKWEE